MGFHDEGVGMDRPDTTTTLPRPGGLACPPGALPARAAPGLAVRLVVTNLLVGRAPLYALGEWAAPYAPHLPGLGTGDLGAVNDDRVGRALDALFDADRAS